MILSGVSTACLYPMNLEDALYKLAVNNIDCVEIFINTHSEMEKSFVDKIKSILQEYDMTVSSIHPYTCGIEPMMFFTQYERRFFDILDYYKKYFELMNILGAKTFIFHGNKLQNSFPDNQYFERYLRLYETGKSFGITVAHENVARCTGGSLEFLKDMVRQIGDNAKLVLDTKQAVRRGYNPYDFVKELGRNIVHIHLSDYNDTSDCALVGTGKLDFVNFFNELKKNRFTGSIILELYSAGYDNIEQLYHNLLFFRRIIESSC